MMKISSRAVFLACAIGAATAASAFAQDAAPPAPIPGGFQPKDVAQLATLTLVPGVAATIDIDVPGGLSGPQGSLKLEYSGLGEEEGHSPPLAWTAGPEGTQSYAIIMQDMAATGDTPAFLHWVLFDIPAETTSLPAGIGAGETVAEIEGARQLSNSMGSVHYLPPGPPGMSAPVTPAGGENEFSLYTIQLFALGTEIGADATDLASLLAAMEGNVLGYGVEHILLQAGPRPPAP